MPGACCIPAQNIPPRPAECADGESSASCQSLGGIFWPDRTCSQIVCGTRACCHLDGDCSNETALNCMGLGGVWQAAFTQCGFPGVNCTGAPIAACCFPGGTTCDDTTESECDARDGMWKPGFSCADHPCIPSGVTRRKFNPIGVLPDGGFRWGLDLCQWGLFEPMVRDFDLYPDDESFARPQSIHPVRAVEPNWGRDTDAPLPGEPCGYHWGDMALGVDGFAEPCFCSKPFYGNPDYDQTTVMEVVVQRESGVPDDMEESVPDENLADGFAAFAGMYHTPYWIEGRFQSAQLRCGGIE